MKFIKVEKEAALLIPKLNEIFLFLSLVISIAEVLSVAQIHLHESIPELLIEPIVATVHVVPER